jgi:hypothetical protein
VIDIFGGGGFWTNEATKATATDDSGNQLGEAYAPGHGEDSAASARETLADNLASERASNNEDDQSE